MTCDMLSLQMLHLCSYVGKSAHNSLKGNCLVLLRLGLHLLHRYLALSLGLTVTLGQRGMPMLVLRKHCGYLLVQEMLKGVNMMLLNTSSISLHLLKLHLQRLSVDLQELLLVRHIQTSNWGTKVWVQSLQKCWVSVDVHIIDSMHNRT